MVADYKVSIVDRITDLLSVNLDPETHVIYEWDHGTERVFSQRDGGGSLEYNGVYHPNNDLCEPEPFFDGTADDTFVCCWCGRVCW